MQIAKCIYLFCVFLKLNISYSAEKCEFPISNFIMELLLLQKSNIKIEAIDFDPFKKNFIYFTFGIGMKSVLSAHYLFICYFKLYFNFFIKPKYLPYFHLLIVVLNCTLVMQ